MWRRWLRRSSPERMDTIFALSSGRPPAAVAIVLVSGPLAHEAARRLGGRLPAARKASLRELKDPRTGEHIDEALLLRFDAPASATGEHVVEFQCHGGRAVVNSLRSALGALEGLREAQPGEFTRRAFENGRIDLTEAEGLADLLEAETEAQRRAALLVAEGGLRKQIENWRERLLTLSAEAERAIDYDEDDDSRADGQLVRGCAELGSELRSWLERPRVEALRDGVRVVVAGPPNAGKSSLINALSGREHAIVTSRPGTTRDYIEVPLAISGLPILLTDTAGLHETDDEVEAIGVKRASAMIELADVLVWLGDDDAAPGHPRLIRVHPRADLADRGSAPSDHLPVSSTTGLGLGELLGRLREIVTTILPAEGELALNGRQADLIGQAAAALGEASVVDDPVIVAESLRAARTAFDRLTGRAGVEDVLDALFGRFCLGK